VWLENPLLNLLNSEQMYLLATRTHFQKRKM
jgi:hypothetical protein